MTWTNKKTPGATAQLKTGVPAPGSKRPVAPPVYRPSAKRVVIQPKMAERPQPTAPPVYRPQPTPMVLQKKSRQQPQPASALQPKPAFAAGPLRSKPTIQLMRRRNVGPPEGEDLGGRDHKEEEKPKAKVVAEKIRLDAGTTLYHGTRVSEDRWWERELPNSDKDGSGLIFFTVTKGNTPKQGPECHVISYTTTAPLTVLKVTGVNKASYRNLIGQHGVDALWDTCSPNGEENFVIPISTLSNFIAVPSGEWCSIM